MKINIKKRMKIIKAQSRSSKINKRQLGLNKRNQDQQRSTQINLNKPR